MQITIAQSEIEVAITDYIKSIITVREGSNIAIDLKATRGDMGFQAVIDITHGTQQASNNVVHEPVKETPAKEVVVEQTDVQAPRRGRPPKVQQTEETQEDLKPKNEEAEDNGNEGDTSQESSLGQGEQAPADEEKEEVTPAPKRSLFGNLKRDAE